MNIYETANRKVIYPFDDKSKIFLNKNKDV